jgi:hypothetical protein
MFLPLLGVVVPFFLVIPGSGRDGGFQPRLIASWKVWIASINGRSYSCAGTRHTARDWDADLVVSISAVKLVDAGSAPAAGNDNCDPFRSSVWQSTDMNQKTDVLLLDPGCDRSQIPTTGK